MTLQLLPSEFLVYEKNFLFFFITVKIVMEKGRPWELAHFSLPGSPV
jgi:hypothetical protein